MLAAIGSLSYILVFLGLIISGDIFLVASIYSSRLGYIGLPILFVLALCASFCSDAMWYLIGRYVKTDRIKKLPMLRNKPELVERLSRDFEKKASTLLFACKFLYGTRVVTQVLCGAHKMKYIKYFAINCAGTTIWITFLMVLITAINQSLNTFKGTLTKIEISITVVALLLALLRFVMRKFVQEKLIENE